MPKKKTNESVYSKKVQYLVEITGKFGHGTKFTSYGRRRSDSERSKHRSDAVLAGSNRPDGKGPTASERNKRLKKASEIAAKMRDEGEQMDKEQEGRDANPRPNKK